MKFSVIAYFSLTLALWPSLSQAQEIVAAPADSWPMYRGTASLTGLSKSKLNQQISIFF